MTGSQNEAKNVTIDNDVKGQVCIRTKKPMKQQNDDMLYNLHVHNETQFDTNVDMRVKTTLQAMQ